MYMEFFNRIKEEVKARNTTIEDMLATVFNGTVSRDVYNGWRRRNVYPRADQAVAIAKDLNVSVEYLVTGVDKKLLPSRFRNLCRDMQTLSEEDIEIIETIVSKKAKTRISAKYDAALRLKKGQEPKVG